MKRTLTATGLLALVAVISAGVFSTGSALAGGGPNSFFSWTGPLPGLLLVLSLNTQIFKATAETVIECKHFRGHGFATNGNAMTAKSTIVTGMYTSCSAAGIGAVVSPAEYSINADGSVEVRGKPIVVTIPSLGCSLKINNGAPNNNLRLLLFLNEFNTAVIVHVEVGNITSLGTGGACGPAGVEKTEGTYRGLFLVSVHGGTIQWHP
jgi:hypothetical protein